MDIEEFLMRLLLILACFAGPVLLLEVETSVLKVFIYEMFEIDHNIWDLVLSFLHNGKL